MCNEAVVLAVDDDIQVRALLRNALEPGVRVTTAADAEEALLRAWELSPDLILADLLMPGMDGAGFCRVLRAHPATADTPVLALSGADPLSPRARALRAHCAAWIAKPFEVDDLRATVRRWTAPDRRPPRRDTSAPGLGSLTARQREVAALVARGLTNRRIANELVLEEGTVANHVQRLLSRLGFESRVQLAVWAATDGGPGSRPELTAGGRARPASSFAPGAPE
jgi:DNA-binding NarL/FixJ family response regulator